MLNQKYQSQPNAIATYPYSEVRDGTGISTFYGFTYKNLAGVLTYALGNSDEYSETIETSVAGTGGASMILDKDFDLLAFSRPTAIGGTAQINLCHYILLSGGANELCNVWFRIRKWDGTTETEIASSHFDWGVITATQKKVYTARINVPTTQFKSGEILRLTIQVNSDISVSGSTAHYIGHDPENRDGTGIIPTTDNPRTTTKLIFKCPFVLDL